MCGPEVSEYCMNAQELLRIIDAIHREKNIDKEVVFQAIEARPGLGRQEALRRNRRRSTVTIDRKDGSIGGTHNGEPLDPEETVGRIGAQTAKQVIIQKIREAERDALYDEYDREIGQLVTGVVQRYESGAATVSLPNCEADSAAQRANSRRNASSQRARAGHGVRSPQGRQPREGHSQPHPPAAGAAAVRARNSRNRRRRDRDQGHGPRAGLPQQGRRQQQRSAGRLRRRLRRRARQPHQEHRRRTGRRADRHRPLERRHAGADSQRPAAGRSRRSHPLLRCSAGRSCWCAKISCRWPSAAAGRTSAWPASSAAGTSKS